NRYLNEYGQTYNPQRYGGYVRFGMWLMQPRVVREFRSHTADYYATKPEYFEALMAAVDEVHGNPILRQFWRDSDLVPNSTQDHPYGSQNPGAWGGAGDEMQAFENEDRWFMLDNSEDSDTLIWNPNTDKEIKVFSLARVRGETGDREWLLYTYSPLQDRQDVTITIPGYTDVTVDVPVAGAFYYFEESPSGGAGGGGPALTVSSTTASSEDGSNVAAN